MTITALIHGETPSGLPADAHLSIDGATYPIPAAGDYISDRVRAALVAAGYTTDGSYGEALGPLNDGIREIRLVRAAS